ncbi:MAG: aspartyl-tRNA amidotransferase subunit B [Pseudomonadota bacterium]|nr:MAG: aspartyl-tRNA amidotransferase subunit B [Pseudomonadota bacterium]
MTLITQIQNHVKDAMKVGDRLKLSTLRMLVAAIKQKEIDTRSDLSDDDIISIIEKQMQQRLEAAEQYEAAGRNELFEKESQEAEILKAYLPEKMGEEEVKEMIEKIISEMGEISMKEMGNVMSALKDQAGSKIDMKMASQMVREIISKQSD